MPSTTLYVHLHDTPGTEIEVRLHPPEGVNPEEWATSSPVQEIVKQVLHAYDGRKNTEATRAEIAARLEVTLADLAAGRLDYAIGGPCACCGEVVNFPSTRWRFCDRCLEDLRFLGEDLAAKEAEFLAKRGLA